MNYNEVVLGKDLRDFVINLLEEQEKLPKLIKYLASLWEVAESYKEVDKVDFALIAKVFEEAFKIHPKKIDWIYEKKQVESTCKAEFNTPLYLKEIRSYDSFERELRNQLVELNAMQGLFSKRIQGWKNLELEAYLERGTVDWEGYDEIEEDMSWFDFSSILHSGKCTE